MAQEQISSLSHDGPIYISYREIQDNKSEHEKISNDSAINSFLEVIDGFSRQTGKHDASDIDINDNVELLLNDIFESYPSVEERPRLMLMNNFCNSLMTRAREKGKYAIVIVTPSSVLVCHADSKEKTITRDAGVIERLLDTDNVDKYVKFEELSDGEYDVRHYERYRSKSLANWIGLRRGEIAYKSAGDITIFTEISGETCGFEFTQGEFEKKFLDDTGDYDLSNGIFTIPSNDYAVEQIQFGQKTFENTEEFFQNFYTIYYSVYSYRERFDELASTMEPYKTGLYDHKEKVTKGVDGPTQIRKEHDNLNITFASKQISLHAGWKVDLRRKFDEGTEVRIYHAGAPLSKDPITIGQFKIFNEMDIKDNETIEKIYDLVEESKMDGFSNLLCSILFKVIEAQIDPPVNHFFGQMAEHYESRLESDGLVAADETDMLEFKSRNWFVNEDEEDLSQKIISQTQNKNKLLID